jgi:hypothetical protein
MDRKERREPCGFEGTVVQAYERCGLAGYVDVPG